MEVKPGYKKTEVGVIPVDWQVVSLGSSTSMMTNGFVGTATRHYSKNDSGVLYIQGYNVEEGRFNLHGVKYVTDEFHRSHNKSSLQTGDLLTVQTGDVGLTTIVPPSLAGSNCHALIISRINQKKAEPRFVCFYLNSAMGRVRLRLIETGTTMKHINVGDLVDFVLPMPRSLAEQTAIATALSDVDALIDSLEQLIKKKRQIKQGAMQELLTGKRRLPGFGNGKNAYKNTEVGVIPEDWEIRALADCLQSKPKYGINAPAVSFSDQLPVYLRITDISEGSRFAPQEVVSVSHPESNQYFLEDGDLVFARTGASVGKSYLYRTADGPLVFAGFLIRVQPDPVVLFPGFLSAYVNTRVYWNWIRMMSMRSGQPGVNGQEFSRLMVPVPPLPEQTAIATALSDMDSEIESLETKLSKTRQLKQGMMQELLTGRIRLV